MGAGDLPCAGASKHVKALERLGWEVARTTGSHVVLRKDGCPVRITIPDHGGRDVSRMLLARSLKLAGIVEDTYLLAFKGNLPD